MQSYGQQARGSGAIMHLRNGTFPSRKFAVQAALEGLDERAAVGGGALLVLTGARGSGRSRVLEGIVRGLIRASPRTKVLVHERREVVTQLRSWPTEATRFARSAASVGRIAGSAAGVAGLTGVHATMKASTTALSTTTKAVEYVLARTVPDVYDVASFFDQVARMAAGGRCAAVIDDLDPPDVEVWSTRISALVHERLSMTPALLLVSVEATEADDGACPDFLARARRWQQDGRPVFTVHLGDLDDTDLRSLIGRSRPDVLQALVERGQRNARLTDVGWAAWRRTRQVRRSSSFAWTLAAAADGPTPADVTSRLWGRLDARLGGDDAELCREVLAAGALQGETFLVAVAARAAGTDAATAERLLTSAADRDGNAPLLVRPTTLAVPGTFRDPVVAGFVEPSLWQHLEAPGAADRRAQARTQAQQMLELVGAPADHFALLLRNLYRNAGDRQQALTWQQRMDRHLSPGAAAALVTVFEMLDERLVSPEECRRAASVMVRAKQAVDQSRPEAAAVEWG